jgi:hypothetical protein
MPRCYEGTFLTITPEDPAMSQKGFKRFLDEVRKDPALAAAFNKAVARVAAEAGFDATAADAADFFQTRHAAPGTDLPKPGEDKKPQPPKKKWHPDDDCEWAIFPSQAAGEEAPPAGKPAAEKRTVTSLALGEEERLKRMAPLPQATTLAVGEEERRSVKRYIIPREDADGKTGPDLTSMAVGEEEPRRRKPSGPQPK